jgi:hypothetical protein
MTARADRRVVLGVFHSHLSRKDISDMVSRFPHREQFVAS